MKEDEFINSVVNSFLNGKKGVNWMCPLPDSPWAYSDQVVWAGEAADILIKEHGFKKELFYISQGLYSGAMNYNYSNQ
jgi:hypothetical protein